MESLTLKHNALSRIVLTEFLKERLTDWLGAYRVSIPVAGHLINGFNRFEEQGLRGIAIQF
ncbi:hypothetical protein GCM10007858_19240 [Bradyrhizobium liaoningense]|nr:hypothetical protein GCM10007858_19240 [Bradyrhizobium liaoningense]